MNYYRIDVRCEVPNDDGTSNRHMAGRHFFMTANSEKDALERAERHYRFKNVTILHATKINFVPQAPFLKDIP